jgi:plasmid stabilization system protein ParE
VADSAKFEVVFHPAARDEAVEAAMHIADRASPEQADAWLDAIEAAVRTLSEFPRRFPAAREAVAFPGQELRQAIVHSHRVIFTIRGGTVHVLHVRHAAQMDLQGP